MIILHFRMNSYTPETTCFRQSNLLCVIYLSLAIYFVNQLKVFKVLLQATEQYSCCLLQFSLLKCMKDIDTSITSPFIFFLWRPYIYGKVVCNLEGMVYHIFTSFHLLQHIIHRRKRNCSYICISSCHFKHNSCIKIPIWN